MGHDRGSKEVEEGKQRRHGETRGPHGLCKGLARENIISEQGEQYFLFHMSPITFTSYGYFVLLRFIYDFVFAIC